MRLVEYSAVMTEAGTYRPVRIEVDGGTTRRSTLPFDFPSRESALEAASLWRRMVNEGTDPVYVEPTRSELAHELLEMEGANALYEWEIRFGSTSRNLN